MQKIAPHQRRQVHRLPAVRDGLLVRELRRLHAGEVAHQGLRLPRDRPQGAVHLHAVRRGLVPARLPGGGHHGGRGHRRQGRQRDDLRRLQGLHDRLPLRHRELRAGDRQGAEVRPLRRRAGLRRRRARPARSPTSMPTGPASTGCRPGPPSSATSKLSHKETQHVLGRKDPPRRPHGRHRQVRAAQHGLGPRVPRARAASPPSTSSRRSTPRSIRCRRPTR